MNNYLTNCMHTSVILYFIIILILFFLNAVVTVIYERYLFVIHFYVIYLWPNTQVINVKCGPITDRPVQERKVFYI